MTRLSTRTILRLGAAAAALAAVPAPLYAQADEPPAATTEEDAAAAANEAIDEAANAVQSEDADIDVTARRRAESLQDGPVAVTAYQGAARERA
ncbi:MAG: hypothetical protein QOJ27_2577, partial [Sphingomonadales bacterium]|nr:hypothetical protein [Sphingomonadales bacterium]